MCFWWPVLGAKRNTYESIGRKVIFLAESLPLSNEFVCLNPYRLHINVKPQYAATRYTVKLVILQCKLSPVATVMQATICDAELILWKYLECPRIQKEVSQVFDKGWLSFLMA